MPQLRRAVVAAALGALLCTITAPLAVAHDGDQNSFRRHREPGSFRLSYGYNADPLRDLQPSTSEPFDGAYASVTMISWGSGSYFSIRVRGVDQGRSGNVTAPTCTPDRAWPATARRPDRTTTSTCWPGVLPAEVSPDTEVWLDFELNSRGEGRSSTVVPFVPTAGERAIVIHALPTSANGTAGAAICLPAADHRVTQPRQGAPASLHWPGAADVDRPRRSGQSPGRGWTADRRRRQDHPRPVAPIGQPADADRPRHRGAARARSDRRRRPAQRLRGRAGGTWSAEPGRGADPPVLPVPGVAGRGRPGQAGRTPRGATRGGAAVGGPGAPDPARRRARVALSGLPGRPAGLGGRRACARSRTRPARPWCTARRARTGPAPWSPWPCPSPGSSGTPWWPTTSPAPSGSSRWWPG